MFSIAAINDTDSRGQWEPLAPSKEAQEFHLSKTYHEGLLKLHAKEFEKARELLESVLRDPLISSAQVDNIASDGHLLQLRFLSLKNLATTFLQQGSAYHENALQCYLQAVEIDGKDSVVWNQLGTLSCSMGLLSISRWAFEQGLLCSPSNWNCMEKLLEVLIAIGDEVACLSVAKMILRHWPSHSRALHVKNMIEEPEIIPFAPRGIDKLEPKHLRLKFPEKRKATDELADEAAPLKRSKKKIELHLEETSWRALADSLLSILVPLNDCTCDTTMRDVRSGDIQLDVKFPCSSENTVLAFEDGGFSTVNATEDMSQGGDFSAERGTTSKDKATSCLEEQPQERRSSRLERLRCRKSGKEESDYAATRDQAAVVKFLEPFISVGLNADKEHGRSARDSSICHKNASSSEAEHNIIARFLQETSGNIGAYHVAHLLLEEAANRRLSYQDAFIKFLDLEKLTRNWGQERTPECNLFLAELYYDLALTSLEASKLSELLYESSYHLCKVIESVALEHPLSSYWAINYEKSSSLSNPGMVNSLVGSNSPFWVRFFWLSGRLSVLDNDKAKAHKEFSLSLSVFSQKNDKDGPFSVPMPHCRIISELTLERVLYDINMLKLDILMENDATKMMDKGMYTECISLLIPFLFCTKEVYPDVSLLRIPADRISENVASVELLALDLLIRACEKTDPENHELYLNCHQRKLQILMGAAGADRISFHTKPFCQPLRSTSSDMEPRVSSTKQWNYLVAEEVKALSQCVSKVRIQIDQSGEHNGNIFSARSIRDMQYLLLAAMCQFVKMLPSKNSAGCLPANVTEQKQQGCFISAAIAFCKFQHLDPTVPIKTQVELIVAVHDLLAEYGLCCAGEGKNEDQEGTYLKFAMKHLLALDMKFKSTIQSPSNVDDTPLNQQKSEDPHLESNTQILDLEMVSMEAHSMENIAVEMTSSDSCSKIEKDHTSVGYRKRGMDGHSLENRVENKLAEYGGEMTEDEREELESRIDNALDQCFFCLYGLNLRSDSAYEDELVNHRNTSNGDYQTKEQCADVFQYILPYAKGSSRTGLVKLRRVLRTIRKHFPQPPEDILTDSFLDKFLDDAELNEDNLSEEAGSDGFLHTMIKYLFSSKGSIKNYKKSLLASSGPYMDVYCNLFFYLAQSEEMSATDKWTGFVLTKEGEDFVQQNANLFKYDLLYNPLRFESWQRLANIYDEEVDLLLNDGSKHINVMGWRKNASLPLRVETSRRRSRRCLIMSLALAKTPDEQSKIHEWLALVYYDSLQNVVPFYDQRSVLPTKDAMWMRFCENSLTQFKKAFTKKEDWSHAFYMGKLAEKLNYSHEMILSYYNEAISLNPSVVDSIYRMHASRLKLLYKYGKDMKVLKVVSTYCFSQTVKAAVDDILKIDFEVSPPSIDLKEMTAQTVLEETCKESKQLEEAWHMLYADCISALETCVEGDLKHFHKARYMLAQGFYRRALDGDLERAKDELSFCFKSSRSYFTINMWEIDGMVKKGRRKAPGTTGNKKVLEVHLPESSRKFITCIRKYLLFYLRLLEEAKDTHTLDKAFISIRADKRFSLCVEDLVPVALGRYIKALLISMHQTQSGMGINSENILERLFSLFMEQGNLWADLCSLPEMKGSGISENNLYGYLHQYIYNLERNGNLETIEAINERVRKRFKNPKLSNSSCAKVCRHASVSWCRSLIVSLALITPLQPESSIEVKNYDTVENPSESSQQYLFVDLQAEELWNSSFEDSTQLKQLERKWIPILNKIKNAVIRKASDQNFDSANTLLRCAYNFFRESSCATLPTGVKLYLVPKRVALQMQLKPLTDGAELLDVNLPRKLLLWAYTLVHGHWTHISAVLKYCEENVKPKMKKGVAATGTHMSASTSSISACKGVGKDGAATHGGSNEPEPAPVNRASPTGERSSLTSSREGENRKQTSTSGNQIPSGESRKSLLAAPLQQCTNLTAESSSSVAREGGLN